MSWYTGVMVYLLVWWVVLFAILPIGVRPDAEGDAASGGWRGTPCSPRLGRKAAWTTLVTSAIFLGLYVLTENDWLSFRQGWLAMPINEAH